MMEAGSVWYIQILGYRAKIGTGINSKVLTGIYDIQSLRKDVNGTGYITTS